MIHVGLSKKKETAIVLAEEFARRVKNSDENEIMQNKVITKLSH